MTERPRDGRNLSRYEPRPRFFSPHDYEALLLAPGLTGLRLGEFLALRRADFDGCSFSFRFSAHEGELIESSHEKNHERTVPVPPSLAELIRRRPPRIDTDLLFPTPPASSSASATSTATSGFRPNSRPASTRPPTSSAIPTSATSAPNASTTPT
ncbi:MAG: hypothetical protein U0R71_01325 [Solirubrobacterales bacterium]